MPAVSLVQPTSRIWQAAAPVSCVLAFVKSSTCLIIWKLHRCIHSFSACASNLTNFVLCVLHVRGPYTQVFGSITASDTIVNCTMLWHAGVLRPENDHPEITNTHEIVLFHYFTRSFEDYIDRKILRIAGRQTVDYRMFCEDNFFHPEDPDAIAAYETLMGFATDHPVCALSLLAIPITYNSVTVPSACNDYQQQYLIKSVFAGLFICIGCKLCKALVHCSASMGG